MDKSLTLRCLLYAQHKMQKNTIITATQNTTETAAQTSCPTMGETLPESDILIGGSRGNSGSSKTSSSPLK